jgi:hypothetical protein
LIVYQAASMVRVAPNPTAPFLRQQWQIATMMMRWQGQLFDAKMPGFLFKNSPIEWYLTALKPLLLEILPSCLPLGRAQMRYAALGQELIELGFQLGRIGVGCGRYGSVMLRKP